MKTSSFHSRKKASLIQLSHAEEAPFLHHTISTTNFKPSMHKDSLKKDLPASAKPFTLSYSSNSSFSVLASPKQSLIIKGRPNRPKTESSNLSHKNSRIAIYYCSRDRKENIQSSYLNETMDLRRILFKETKNMMKSKKNKFLQKWKLDDPSLVPVPVKENLEYDYIRKICLNDAKLKQIPPTDLKSDSFYQAKPLEISNTANKTKFFSSKKLWIHNNKPVEKVKRLKVHSNYTKIEEKETERSRERERKTVKYGKHSSVSNLKFEENQILPWKISTNWFEEN